MKISKQRANDAAIKICAPLLQNIKDHDEKINSTVRAMRLNKVPKEVRSFFDKFPDYFKREGSYYLGQSNREGIYARYGSDKYIPEPQNKEETAADKNIIHGLLNTKEKLQEKYNDSVLKIEKTILALGTEKRVLDEFPEAAPFLDCQPTNTGLMLNIQPIRKLACSLITDCKTA